MVPREPTESIQRRVTSPVGCSDCGDDVNGETVSIKLRASSVICGSARRHGSADERCRPAGMMGGRKQTVCWQCRPGPGHMDIAVSFRLDLSTEKWFLCCVLKPHNWCFKYLLQQNYWIRADWLTMAELSEANASHNIFCENRPLVELLWIINNSTCQRLKNADIILVLSYRVNFYM